MINLRFLRTLQTDWRALCGAGETVTEYITQGSSCEVNELLRRIMQTVGMDTMAAIILFFIFPISGLSGYRCFNYCDRPGD